VLNLHLKKSSSICCRKKGVADLIDLNVDDMFVVCGEVVGIVDEQEWWYPTCKCDKGVVPDSGTYFCNACGKHVFQVVPRYVIFCFSFYFTGFRNCVCGVVY
jgi:hypothetical protein